MRQRTLHVLNLLVGAVVGAVVLMVVGAVVLAVVGAVVGAVVLIVVGEVLGVVETAAEEDDETTAPVPWHCEILLSSNVTAAVRA